MSDKKKLDVDSLCLEISSLMVLETAKRFSEASPKDKKKIMKQMLRDAWDSQNQTK